MHRLKDEHAAFTVKARSFQCYFLFDVYVLCITPAP